MSNLKDAIVRLNQKLEVFYEEVIKKNYLVKGSFDKRSAKELREKLYAIDENLFDVFLDCVWVYKADLVNIKSFQQAMPFRNIEYYDGDERYFTIKEIKEKRGMIIYAVETLYWRELEELGLHKQMEVENFVEVSLIEIEMGSIIEGINVFKKATNNVFTHDTFLKLFDLKEFDNIEEEKINLVLGNMFIQKITTGEQVEAFSFTYYKSGINKEKNDLFRIYSVERQDVIVDKYINYYQYMI